MIRAKLLGSTGWLKFCFGDWISSGWHSVLCNEFVQKEYNLPKEARRIRLHAYDKPTIGTGNIPIALTLVTSASYSGVEWNWKGRSTVREGMYIELQDLITEALDFDEKKQYEIYLQIEWR